MVYQEKLFPDLYRLVAEGLGIPLIWAIILIAIITVWSLIWKGLALWKAAKRNQPNWFIILLVINTVGILEILYIYIFSEIKFDEKKKKKARK